MRDLLGKLRLRVGFCEACDVYHFTSFQLSEPRRKQDRKSRILASDFSGQFDSCHSWHRVVRYQKISSQSTFKKPQRLYGGVRFNYLMSQVFQEIDSTGGDQKIIIDKENPRWARGFSLEIRRASGRQRRFSGNGKPKSGGCSA